MSVTARHDFWTRAGRRLRLSTGQKVYTAAIGQRNLELPDGTFAPYLDDGRGLRWHGGRLEPAEAGVRWGDAGHAGRSTFTLRRSGRDLPAVATWERLPDELQGSTIAEGNAAGLFVVHTEVARVRLTLAAEDAFASITFHVGGHATCYAAFELLALADDVELVCRHELANGFEVRVLDREPWRRVEVVSGGVEHGLPMPAGEVVEVCPDTFGPVSIATSSDDAMGDAGGYQQDGDGGFGTIYVDDTDGSNGYYVSGHRWASVNLGAASSINSGTQISFSRATNNNGANGTCIVAAENSNTPATYSTSSRPYARSYLTSALATHNFPNDGTTQTPSLTTQIGGLLAAGYGYTGSSTHAIAIGIGANQFDTILGTSLISGSVSWRTICRDYSFGAGTRSTLTVVFTEGGGGGVTVTPGAASLTTTRFAPVLRTQVTPSTATLAATRFAPELRTTVTPGVAAVETTTFAPVIQQTDHVTVTPGAGSLLLTGFAPRLEGLIAVPATGLALTPFAPTVEIGANVTVVPSTAELSLTRFAPELRQRIEVPFAELVLTPFAPSVSSSEDVTVTPGNAALVLTTFAPSISGGSTTLYYWLRTS